MKNVILTFIVSLTLTSLQANYFSQLNLTMVDQANFEVKFNNRFFGTTGNSFTIDNLAPGRYPLMVSKLLPTHRGYQKKVIYCGTIDIPAGSNVNAKVDRFNRLQLSYVPIACENTYNHGQCGPAATGYYEPMPMGMNPNTFGQLKNAFSNRWFDNDKLQLARQAVRSNNVTAIQVADIMSLFSFDNSKLEVAKVAYATTIDKQNYYIVNNQFTFSSSILELEEYINHF